VGNLGGVGTVVHQQKFELLEVGDGELAESVGKKVTGLLGRSVTDLGHRSLALEASADTTVNTLGLSPGFLQWPKEKKKFSQLGTCGITGSYRTIPCSKRSQGEYTYTNTHKAVRLVTLEVSSALLHDGVLDSRSDHICLNEKLRIRYNGHESIVNNSPGRKWCCVAANATECRIK
jgi:hypothetical protein